MRAKSLDRSILSRSIVHVQVRPGILAGASDTEHLFVESAEQCPNLAIAHSLCNRPDVFGFLIPAQILHFVSALPVRPRFVALVDAVGVHVRVVELAPRVPPEVYR